jgi:short-subunit dehydrogenase
MEPVIAATEDIDVTLVFNNAGFITTGFFHKTPIGRSMANFNCNATAVLPITHHFLAKMIAKGQKGLMAYTSSSAGLVPNPLSVIYPSTKSFLTFFATSLAPEIKSKGVDVVVVHPSPMMTNFFQNSDGMSTLDSFKRFAVGPSVIADVVFNSAGRFVVRDQGLITIILRLVTKILDANIFAELVCRTAHTTGDFKNFDAK